MEKRKIKKHNKTVSKNIWLALFTVGIIFSILVLYFGVNSVIASAKNDPSPAYKDKDVPGIRTKSIWKEWKDMTPSQRNTLRKEAAKRLENMVTQQIIPNPCAPDAINTPHYFGPCPNYATSQLPIIDNTGAISGGIRKFIDPLPNIPVANPDKKTYPGSDYYEIALREYTQQMHTDLSSTKLRGYVQLNFGTDSNGQNTIPPAQIRYLGPVIIAQKDRPVRVKFINQLPNGTDGDLFIPVDTTVPGAGQFTINSQTGKISGNFVQNRATLHLHGGHTPWISDGTPHQWITPANEVTSYPEGVSVRNVPDMYYDANGNQVPEGTPGATNDPGKGSITFFYTNNQSARFMFYHDHSFGITRLNVYAGEAAGYMIQDPVEKTLINGGTIQRTDGTTINVAPGTIPVDQIPLVIQDKTFVPDTTNSYTNMWGTFDSQLAFQDPTWDTNRWGGTGNLWFPHVYETLQNPGDIGGINAFGRWHYAPWFWPPWTVKYGPVPNPYYDCYPGGPCTRPWEPSMNPGTPNPSIVAEAFMDTPVVNGVAYPYIEVDPKAYRFRILNAANDRFFNLQLYQATSIVDSIKVTDQGNGYTSEPTVKIKNAQGDTTGHGASATATVDLDPQSSTYGKVTAIVLHSVGSGYTLPPIVDIAPPVSGTQAYATAKIYTTSSTSGVGMTEVGMIPADPSNACDITPNLAGISLPTDGREGGIPDPTMAGPQMIQIGTDGGLLPKPVTLPNQPVDWNWDQGTFDFGIVNTYNLFLGPAERADVIVDFSQFAGKTLILYNDAPAPVPAADPRLDYYTGDIDQTEVGGVPTTLPGYGPNIRTIMQIRVKANSPVPYDPAPLDTVIPAAFNASQMPIIVPEASYNSVYNSNFPIDPFVRIHDESITFTPIGLSTPVTIPFERKAIQDEMGEAFDRMYGRNGGMMGLEMPPQQGLQTTLLYNYVDPPVDIIKESMSSVPIGTLGDGTQIWMITHNGVDTHPMHWHGYEIQLINRVAWDNNVRLPDRNELGWRETLTINPLQNTIVAVRPIRLQLPFDLPNSIRLLDPTKPEGEVLKEAETVFDPHGEPIPALINHPVNFGWEYVWHCHILEHEEMDLMHSVILGVPPKAPYNLTATAVIGPGPKVNPQGKPKVILNWTDNSTNEVNFTIQRSIDNVNWKTIANIQVPSTIGPTTGNKLTYEDKNVVVKATYNYRVIATNIVGDTWNYRDPNINEGPVGFPTMSIDSESSNTATVTVVARV